MLKVSQRIDNLNQVVSSPALNNLGIEIPNVRTHKQVDELRAAVIETIEKQGHQYLINDDASISLVPKKKPAKKASAKTQAPAKKGKAVTEPTTADEDTVLLIGAVIGANAAEAEEWYRTGDWIYSRKASFGTEAKENRKVMYKLLDKSSGGAIPEKGTSNTGEEITLRKKNGAVKWAAWSETRRWTQYLARIFQGIEAAGWKAVFPEGRLITKAELDELLKNGSDSPGEPAWKTVERSVQMATKKLEECDSEGFEEMATAIIELNAMFATYQKNVKK